MDNEEKIRYKDDMGYISLTCLLIFSILILHLHLVAYYPSHAKPRIKKIMQITTFYKSKLQGICKFPLT